MEIEIEGLRELKADFAKASAKAGDGVMKGLEKVGLDIVAEAKKNLNQNKTNNTGTLRASGKVQNVLGRHGEALPYEQIGDKVMVGGEYAEVVFTTEVVMAEFNSLLPVVLKYATALYDGEDSVKLNSILKEAM